MATADVIRQCVALLCESFTRTPSELTYAAYTMGLHDMSDADVKRATAESIRCSRFMPSVAELLELATGGPASSKAVLAFEQVSRAAVAVGGYHTVDFADGVINASIQNLGGWNRICELPADEFDTFFRKEFISTYTTLSKSNRTAGAQRGIYDCENGKQGLPSPNEVVRIEADDNDIPRVGWTD